MESTLEQFFSFTTLIEKLKKIERFKNQYYWRDYHKPERYESVADHTWRVSILVLLFGDKLLKSFDTEKALKMALVHDLPEIIIGDKSPMGEDGTGRNTFAFDKQEAEIKRRQEKQSAKFLFDNLPEPTANELFATWLEFNEQKSFEACVVKALDRIEAMIQILEYSRGYLFENHLEFTIKYGLEVSDIDPVIVEFGELIADKLRRHFKELKK